MCENDFAHVCGFPEGCQTKGSTNVTFLKPKVVLNRRRVAITSVNIIISEEADTCVLSFLKHEPATIILRRRHAIDSKTCNKVAATAARGER